MVTNKTHERHMAAAIRLARRNLSRTGVNPSVGTIIVKSDGDSTVIVGRGVTALGGRPHAEPVALSQAADLAKGATAYVTLEPCAHHGATPSCAQLLIDAGVSQVITGWLDPDARVDGRGHEMLRQAGIEVIAGVLPQRARQGLAGYLSRKQKNRPYVTVKLAVSSDGMIGAKGRGQVPITGEIAKRQVHMMRAANDAILVGAVTARDDDPELTCRLPDLQSRSPHRFVLDPSASIAVQSRLMQTLSIAALSVVTAPAAPEENIAALKLQGASIFAGELVDGRIALPELLDDMAATGISSLFVEGGALTVQSFLDDGLVDEIALFTGSGTIGADGIRSPFTNQTMPKGFALARHEEFADDQLDVFVREQA